MNDTLQRLATSKHQNRLILVIAFLILLSASAIIAKDFALDTLTVPLFAAWFICYLIFTLADLLAGEIERGLWAGYLYLAMAVAWLTLGLSAGLGILVAGAGTAAFIRQRNPKTNLYTPLSSCTPGSLFQLRITLSGISLLSAVAIYHGIGGTVPIKTDVEGLAQIFFALSGGLLLTLLAGALLLRLNQPHRDTKTAPLEQWHRQIIHEVLLLLIIIPLEHVYSAAGVPAFVVLMGLVAAQAIRYHQIGLAKQRLTQHIQELTLLSNIGRNISVNLVLDDVLLSTYDWVKQLVDVSAFYIALCDGQRDLIEYPLYIQNDQQIDRSTRSIESTPAIAHILKEQTLLRLRWDEAVAFPDVFEALPENHPHLVYSGFPLVTGAKPLGVMGIISNTQFSELEAKQLQTLESIANQAGLAIGNAILYDRSVRLADNLNRINRSMQGTVFNMDDTQATMQEACNTAISITNAQKAALLMIDNEDATHINLRESIGLNEAHQQYYAEIEYQLDVTKPHVVTNTAKLAAQAPRRKLAEIGGFKAMAELPLKSGEIVTGLLVVFHDQPHYYAEAELELLDTLAYQVAATLENAALLGALELYASEQAQLVQLSQISTSSLELRTVINRVTEVLTEISNMQRIYIGLLTNDRQKMQYFQHDGQLQQTFFIDDIAEVATLLRQTKPKHRIYHRKDGVLSEELQQLLPEMATLVLVPLVADNNLLGIIFLGDNTGKEMQPGEWRRMEMAANQIAAQFHNAQLHDSTQAALNRRLEQLSMIEDIAQQISSTHELGQIIRNVLDAALQSSQADLAILGLKSDGEELFVRVVENVNGEWVSRQTMRPETEGLMGDVLKSGEILVVDDNRTMPGYLADLFEKDYLSSAIIPLCQEDEIIGVLNLESRQLNHFNDEHIAFLKSLAGHAVISIQNTQLLQEHQTQIETLIWLRDLSLRLSSDTNQESVVATVLKTAQGILQGNHAALFRCYTDTDSLILLGSMSSEAGEFIPVQVFIPTEIMRDAVHTGKIQTIENARKDLSHHHNAEINYASLIVAPVKHGGQIHEVLCVTGEKPHRYTNTDINTIELLASQVAGHLENVLLYERSRTASSRMRAILDSTREGIILLDPAGRLIEANASAEHLLNMDMEDHVGQNFVEFLMTHLAAISAEGTSDATTQESLTDMARILRLEPERITRRSLEVIDEGKPRYLEEVGSPVLGQNGRVIGRLLTLRDVTEERLLAAYRNEISSMVVHDLRGPLSSIITSHDMMYTIAQELDNDELSAILNVSLESSNAMMNLVESLMDIAKLETRRMPLKQTTMDLKALIDNAIITLSGVATQAQINVEHTIPDDLPSVFVDGDKIRRVMINILDNAIRYTPMNSKVHITAEHNGDKVIVRVSDSGPGIPTDEVEHIFEKFRQSSKNVPLRGSKGNGLGLTFCKLTMEAHGESIWAGNSKTLPGACFSFTLPVAVENG